MKSRGFTLVELVITLIVIGIIAVTAMSRMDFTSGFSQRAYHDKLKAGLQFARKTAVASRRYVCVGAATNVVTFTIDSNAPESTVTPFGGTCPFANALSLPSPDSSCSDPNKICAPPSAVPLTPSAASFQFDAKGASSARVTFDSTGQPKQIVVEAETGYVY